MNRGWSQSGFRHRLQSRAREQPGDVAPSPTHSLMIAALCALPVPARSQKLLHRVAMRGQSLVTPSPEGEISDHADTGQGPSHSCD